MGPGQPVPPGRAPVAIGSPPAPEVTTMPVRSSARPCRGRSRGGTGSAGGPGVASAASRWRRGYCGRSRAQRGARARTTGSAAAAERAGRRGDGTSGRRRRRRRACTTSTFMTIGGSGRPGLMVVSPAHRATCRDTLATRMASPSRAAAPRVRRSWVHLGRAGGRRFRPREPLVRQQIEQPHHARVRHPTVGGDERARAPPGRAASTRTRAAGWARPSRRRRAGAFRRARARPSRSAGALARRRPGSSTASPGRRSSPR